MANLQFTQATWSDLFRMLSVWGRAINILRAKWRFYRDRRTQVLEEFEQQALLSGWTLNGVDIGVNTAETGELFVNATVAGANVTIDLYETSAKAAGDKVATSGLFAFPGTATLTASNASGMTGSVVVGTFGVTDTDIVLNVLQDLNLLISNTFPIDNANDDKSATAFKTYISATLEPDARTALAGLIEQFRAALTSWLKKRTAAPDNVSSKGVVTYTLANIAGAISIGLEEGMSPWLADAMGDETVAAAQTILQNTVTLGTLVDDADNAGDIVLGSTASREHALSGTIRLTCVDETVGSERFSVEHILAEPLADGTEILAGENEATIKKGWTDGRIAVTFTPNRGTIIESGDDGAMMATYIVTGETDANTDFGVIYFRVTRNAGAPIWTIEAFVDQAFGNLIGSVTTNTVLGVVALVITGQGLTINFDFDRVAANVKLPVAGNQDLDIKIDLQANEIGDRYQFTVTNDYAGRFQSLWAYLFQHSLPSVAAANTIDDGMMKSVPLALESSNEI